MNEKEMDLPAWRAKAELRGDQLRMLHDWLIRKTSVWDDFVQDYPWVADTWFDETGRPK